MGVVNGRPNFFALIARLPPRVWLQAALGLIAFAVLAVLGFAVIAGFVAVLVVIMLLYRLRGPGWMRRPVSAGPPADAADPRRRPKGHRRTYEIVDRARTTSALERVPFNSLDRGPEARGPMSANGYAGLLRMTRNRIFSLAPLGGAPSGRLRGRQSEIWSRVKTHKICSPPRCPSRPNCEVPRHRVRRRLLLRQDMRRTSGNRRD